VQVNHPNIVGYKAAWLEPFLGESQGSSSDEHQSSTTGRNGHVQNLQHCVAALNMQPQILCGSGKIKSSLRLETVRETAFS
jgi:hypothetical protein